MLGVMVSIIRANPAFHAKWARFALQAMEGPVEIKITGENPDALLRDFLSHYIPGSIFSGKLEGLNIQGPDVNDNAGNGKIYVCRSKTCFPPVDTPAEALDLIRNVT
jgi:uncharacterized protein YyaL (SSP411 family)